MFQRATVITVRTSADFFVDIHKLILHFIKNSKRSRITKSILAGAVWGDFICIFKSYKGVITKTVCIGIKIII